jgi:hypothetical protein
VVALELQLFKGKSFQRKGPGVRLPSTVSKATKGNPVEGERGKNHYRDHKI